MEEDSKTSSCNTWRQNSLQPINHWMDKNLAKLSFANLLGATCNNHENLICLRKCFLVYLCPKISNPKWSRKKAQDNWMLLWKFNLSLKYMDQNLASSKINKLGYRHYSWTIQNNWTSGRRAAIRSWSIESSRPRMSYPRNHNRVLTRVSS